MGRQNILNCWPLALYQELGSQIDHMKGKKMTDQFLQFDRRTLLAGMLATGATIGHGQASWAKGGARSDYDLARELYRYAFPLIFFGRYRHNSLTGLDVITRQQMVVNQWSHASRTVTPESTGAPQTDTLYSILLGDLSQEPLLLTIPQMDGRYWSIQCCDFFGSTFAMINRRNTPAAARVALVGPNWRGRIPNGVDAVHRSPTPLIFTAMRTHFVSEADREVVRTLRTGFSAAPLSGQITGQSKAANLVAPSPRGDDPLADFKLLAAMWAACPPPSADRAYLRQFRKIGFGPGAKPDIGALSVAQKAVFAQAEADGFAEVVAATKQAPGQLTRNGWAMFGSDLGLYRNRDYLFRAMVAQQGIIATPVTENVYMSFQKFSDGSRLNGSDRFEIVFDAAALADVGAFWSIHAYRLATFSVIPNALERYSISSRTQNLKFGADGSLTVYAQSSDPGGERSNNWLPTKAGEELMLMTRAYEPKGKIADLTWPGPMVRRG